MSVWIHVKDDRPRVGDEFLIWVDPQIVFSHCEKGWPCDSPIGVTISKTLPANCYHWMPLPKAPE